MIESNVITKILKRNIIYYYKYLINKNYNIILKTHMDMIACFQKKNYICFINIKNLNKLSKNSFIITKKEKLISLTNKVEREFV